jgi:hypothetical protein
MIPTAMGLPVYVSLLIGIAGVAGLIFLFGKNPENKVSLPKSD